MPFATIEIPESMHFSFQPFALEFNQYLSDALEVPIEKCKIKLMRFPEWFVGKGAQEDSCARLRVEFLSGRNRKKLLLAGEELVRMFSAAVRSQNPTQPCRIIVDFHEIDRELLFVERMADSVPPTKASEQK